MKKQGDHSTDMSSDLEAYVRRLKETNPLRESVLRSAMQVLNLAQGSKGLDAGCGIGLQSLLLADEVGPHGHITGLDIAPEFLHLARNSAAEHGLTEQITFKEGDLENLPFGDFPKTFDICLFGMVVWLHCSLKSNR